VFAVSKKTINPIEFYARGFHMAGVTRDQKEAMGNWAASASPEDLIIALKIQTIAFMASQRQSKQALEESLTDEGTGIIPNRRFFEQRLGEALNMMTCAGNMPFNNAADTGVKKSIIYFDIVGLTKINKMGQSAGDAAIQSVAQALVDHVREDETAARVGGDEFAAIVTADNTDAVIKRMEGVFNSLTYEYEGGIYPVQVYVAPFEIDPTQSTQENMRITGEMLAQAKVEAGVGRLVISAASLSPSLEGPESLPYAESSDPSFERN
jgi:diguanylate cyclase (GGDEF)-like protein